MSVSELPALTSEEVTILATYNSEQARGIVHTIQWIARMSALQERFDAMPHPADGPERSFWRQFRQAMRG